MTTPYLALTARELETLHALAVGATYREIARAMFVAESTVKFRATRIHEKLHARNRANAIHIAWQLGLLGHAQPSTGRPQDVGTDDPQGTDGNIKA